LKPQLSLKDLKFFIEEHAPSKRITRFAGFHKHLQVNVVKRT